MKKNKVLSIIDLIDHSDPIIDIIQLDISLYKDMAHPTPRVHIYYR